MLTSVENLIQNYMQNGFASFNTSAGTSSWLILLVIVTGIFLISIVSFYLVRYLLLRFTATLSTRPSYIWIQSAYGHRFFHRLSLLIPSFIIYSSIHLIEITGLPTLPSAVKLIETLALVYMIIIGAFTISSLLNSIETRYQYLKIARHYSIKSYLQVAKIILYCLTGILVISVFVNKSPMYFLTGLGAMTAVILLIFRDSILGFVASIQLSAYDMVRIGDWIEMPNFGADGNVIDISLNTIKIQNFDKTIVTIPSYALLSNGVKNWRGMSESGGRRIKRAFFVDVNSIKFCDETLFNRLSQIPLLRTRLQHAKEGLNQSNDHMIAKLAHANERCMTNLTAFRIYLEAYLQQHPKVHHEMTFIVRELETSGKGIPIELYLFSNDIDWARYEKIQADIFDYIYAILPLFELRAFQYLSGSGLEFRLNEPFSGTENSKSA
ncbi:mechanosensitive ion channel family protein [Aquicella lusitana]|uniref:Miniconductance mechanosensitive channel n=1 Tax=Aquicella lusitana TaxID=254246 RepID=A0A370GMD6_9COXI|nr:mechanosensitive ion channel family protein [Aquicella lusitana]RDI44530.1 miniconductance mechanosensitive channel [Aquicella lusitana]VVC72528.1 Miniconductance mechanosensitive channel YbdG [Aquicella lusitana]